MNRYRFILVVTALVAVASPAHGRMEWQQPRELTRGTQYNWVNEVTASGDLVVAAGEGWIATNPDDPDTEVYAWLSDSGGDAWSEPVNLTNDPYVYETSPSLAATRDSVLIAWQSQTPFDAEDFREAVDVRRYANGGWSPARGISGNLDLRAVSAPYLAAAGSSYYAAWGEARLYFTASRDDGIEWTKPVALSGKQRFNSVGPAIAASAGNVVVVWEGDRKRAGTGLASQRNDLYVRTSTNGGRTWSPVRSLTDTLWWEFARDVDIRGRRAVVAWERYNSNQDRRFLLTSYSTDAGKHWSRPKQLLEYRAQEVDGTLAGPFLDVVASEEGFEIYLTGVEGGYHRYLSRRGQKWTEGSVPFSPGAYSGMEIAAARGMRHVVVTREDDPANRELVYIKGVKDGASRR